MLAWRMRELTAIFITRQYSCKILVGKHKLYYNVRRNVSSNDELLSRYAQRRNSHKRMGAGPVCEVR